jgi:hypothetical protein
MVKRYTHTLWHANYLVQPTGGVSVLKTVCPAKFITNQFDAISLYDHFYTDNIEERVDFFKFVKRVKEYTQGTDLSIFKEDEQLAAEDNKKQQE